MNPQNVDVEALKQRLQQRLGFLQHDPGNAALYGDTVDLAITLADWPTVEALLGRAPAGFDAAAIANYRALHALGSGRPDLAVQVLQPFLQQATSSPVVDTMRYNAAYALALTGDYAAAERLLLEAESLSDDASYLLIHVLMLQQRGEDALKLGQAYYEAGRRAPRVLGIHALGLTDAGRFDEADQAARQALLQAEDPLALCAMGMVRMGTDSAASARAYFERSLAQDSRTGRAWLGLGMCQMVAGELPQARETLQRATHYNDKHPGSWHALGWTLLALGEVGEAEAAFIRALEADRNFADSHGALAVISALRGHQAESEHYASVALRLDPRSMAGHYARSVLADSKGDGNKAQAMIKSLLASQLADGNTLLNAVNRMRGR